MLQSNWILLVEDNEDDILLLQRVLDRQQIGTRIVTARDGAQAVEVLRNGPAVAGQDGPLALLPVLVLLDINLPKLNGLEVLNRIRNDARTRLLRVVMLTTSDQHDDLESAYRQGANSYVRKPVDFIEFREVVTSIGRYWLGLNEPLPLPR